MLPHHDHTARLYPLPRAAESEIVSASFLVKDIFTDFKQHDLGTNFYERNWDGTSAASVSNGTERIAIDQIDRRPHGHHIAAPGADLVG